MLACFPSRLSFLNVNSTLSHPSYSAVRVDMPACRRRRGRPVFVSHVGISRRDTRFVRRIDLPFWERMGEGGEEERHTT